jgi:hypothetical protein
MDIRKTLITVGVLAVLFGASVLVYKRVGQTKPDSAEESTRTLAEKYGFEPDSITRLTVAFADATKRPTLELEKTGRFWRIVKPIQARADSAHVNDLIGAFKTKIRKRVPPNDREYGLDHPQLTVAVTTVDGQSKTFLFGDKGVSYSLYMRERDDKDAAIVESYTLDDLSKTPDELRDRNVLQFDPADVTRIEVRRRSGTIAVERADGSWALKEPVAVPASAKAVDKALEALSGLGVSVFLSENVTDFAPFGLANPPLTVTLRLKDSNPLTLNVVDTPTQEGRIVVSVAGEHTVAAVAPEFLASLPKSAFDWRDRRIADFQRTETSRVEIRTGDKEIVLEKRAGDAPGWFIIRPESAKADDARVDDLLFRLDALEATRMLEGASKNAAKYGLDRPSLTLVFKGSTGKPFERTIRFGKRIGQEVAVQSSRSGDVAVVPASAISGWTDDVASFRVKSPASSPAPAAR